MKYLLIILLSFLGLSSYSQLMQTNGTAGGYQWVASKSDSLHIIPRGSDTPNIGSTKYGKSTVGAMFYKTTDSTLWIKSANKWNQVTGTGGSGGSGITSLGQGYGVVIVNDSTYNVDSSLFISVQHFYNTIDSVINTISSSGIDSIVVNSPLAIDFTNRQIPVISYTGDTTRYFIFEAPIQANVYGDTVYVYLDSTGNGNYSIAHHSFGYYLGVFLTSAQAANTYITYDSAQGKFMDTAYLSNDTIYGVKNGAPFYIATTGGSGSVEYVISGLGTQVDSSGRAYTVNVDTASTVILSRQRAAATYIPLIRTVTAGVGLSGGGALSSNITLNVDTLVISTRAWRDKLADSLGVIIATKQPTGNYITALTGDVTASGPGSVAATLATVNSNVGSFGSASKTVTTTVNSKGLTTAISEQNIQIAESQVTNLVTDLAGKLNTSDSSTKYITPTYYYANVDTAFKLAYPFTDSTYGFGTSIIANYGLSSATNGFFTAAGRYYNKIIYNQAVSSSAIRKAYYLFSTTKVNLTTYPLLTDAYFNNVRTTTSLTPRYNTAMAGMRAIAALQWQQSIQFIYSGASGTQNSNVTLSNSSGWAPAGSVAILQDYGSRTYWYRNNVAAQAGCNLAYKVATVANETMTITNVVGSGIAIGTWGTDGSTNNYSRITYAVDGVTIGTYTPNGQTYLGNTDGGTTDGLINDAIVVTGLKDTIHTVVLTFLDGSKATRIDYVAGLLSAWASKNTPIYIMDAYHMSNNANVGYNYPSFVTTQTIVDSASYYVKQNMLSTFPGYSFAFVPTNRYYDPSISAQVQSDGIHPTTLGHTKLLNALTDVLMKYPIGSNGGNNPSIVATSPLSGGVITRVPVWSSATTLTNSANFVYDYTNSRLGLGVTPSYPLHMTSSAQNQQMVVESSRSSGSNNAVQLDFRNTDATNNKVQFTIGGATVASGFGRTWSFGTDATGTGYKDFYIYSGNLTSSIMYMNNIGSVVIQQATGLINPTIDTSTALEVRSTVRGFMTPRMTGAQRDAIVTPGTGLLVYNTDNRSLSQYNGSNFINDIIVSSAASLTLKYGNDYVFSGTTTTWTLPAISGTIIGRTNMIRMKNRGSGAITLNTATGNTLYTSAATNTITIAAGAACELLPDGTYNLVQFNQ